MIYRLAIGTYTEKAPHVDGHAEGIYLCRFDSGSGKLETTDMIKGIANPSYVTADASGRRLYSGSEHRGDAAGGQVAAFAIVTGVTRLGPPRSSRGSSPCHLTLAAAGRWLLVANYSSGTIAVLPVRTDGHLDDAVEVVTWQGSGPDPERQRTPHAHQILAGPDGRIYAVDLGTDRVWIYELDGQRGKLTPASPQPWLSLPPGSGPRHFTFGRQGGDIYVVTEMGNTVVHFTRESDGRYRQSQVLSSLPPGFTGSSSGAAIRLAPSGRHLYASNRWHDSIACFAVDAATGAIESRGHFSTRGRTPRDFALTPDGDFLLSANQDSSTVTVFRVEKETGALIPVGEPAPFASPVCLAWIPPAR
jgi:6-phosphogluconolactonase